MSLDPQKAYLKIYGCQMNEQDGLHMQRLLKGEGYSFTESPQEAGLVVLVTCSIREKAVQKVFSDLGRIRLIKEVHPEMLVGVAGCVAQQEKENLIKRFPHVDLVFGPDAIRDLPQMLSKVKSSKQQGYNTPVVSTRFDHRKDFTFLNLMPDEEESRVKAFVNIQKGCDNVCAFCIVPRVRGAEVSRPSDDIVNEINDLVSVGVKEVILLGQNVNSYGVKHSSEISFARLLERIEKETDLPRLKFLTSHPQDVKEDLIERFANQKNLCPYFHLPVQSGSNRILEQMRRGYTREDYIKIVDQVRKARPGIAISTDVIVGFPGETEGDFQASLDLISDLKIDMSFSYVYSPRPGTSAINLADDVPMAEKVKRLDVLQGLQREISLAQTQQLVGSYSEVLVESSDDTGKILMGRTPTHRIVYFQCAGNLLGQEDSLIGKMLKVKLTKASPNSLEGIYE